MGAEWLIPRMTFCSGLKLQQVTIALTICPLHLPNDWEHTVMAKRQKSNLSSDCSGRQNTHAFVVQCTPPGAGGGALNACCASVRIMREKVWVHHATVRSAFGAVFEWICLVGVERIEISSKKALQIACFFTVFCLFSCTRAPAVAQCLLMHGPCCPHQSLDCYHSRLYFSCIWLGILGAYKLGHPYSVFVF